MAVDCYVLFEFQIRHLNMPYEEDIANILVCCKVFPLSCECVFNDRFTVSASSQQQFSVVDKYPHLKKMS